MPYYKNEGCYWTENLQKEMYLGCSITKQSWKLMGSAILHFEIYMTSGENKEYFKLSFEESFRKATPKLQGNKWQQLLLVVTRKCTTWLSFLQCIRMSTDFYGEVTKPNVKRTFTLKRSSHLEVAWPQRWPSLQCARQPTDKLSCWQKREEETIYRQVTRSLGPTAYFCPQEGSQIDSQSKLRPNVINCREVWRDQGRTNSERHFHWKINFSCPKRDLNLRPPDYRSGVIALHYQSNHAGYMLI